MHELLGTRTADKLPCYATGSVSSYPWSELLRKVDAYREAGFCATKLAIGWFEQGTRRSFQTRDPRKWIDLECEKLATIRKHTGPDFTLALDAHMSNDGVADPADMWTAPIASQILKALEPYNLLFFGGAAALQRPRGIRPAVPRDLGSGRGGRVSDHGAGIRAVR